VNTLHCKQKKSNGYYTFQNLHGLLGHPNDGLLAHMAESLNLQLEPKEEGHVCKHCATSKAQRKKIKKKNVSNLATYTGHRLMIDISSVNVESYGGNKYWLLVIDEFTNHAWSFFIRDRSDTAEVMMRFIRIQRKRGNMTVKIIRCDNSGENQSFEEEALNSTDLNLKFEYTAPYTPEQNGKVERKYQTLYGKTRAMLNTALLPISVRNRCWAQCAALATILDNLTASSCYEICARTKFYGSVPRWTSGN